MVEWNLNGLFESFNEKKLDLFIINLEKTATKFQKIRSNLKDITQEEILTFLKEKEEIYENISKVNAYINLKLSEDTSSHKYNALDSKFEQAKTEFENKILFFDLWWISLDSNKAEKIISQSKEYKFYLKNLRKFKEHTLKENEEKIINIKNLTGANSVSNIYDIITNAYTFKFKQEKELSQEEIMQKVLEKDPETRKLAYETVMKKYAQEESVLGELYRAIVVDWIKEGMTLRNYKSPISIRNKANNLPDKSIETLLKVCRKNTSVFQEYFKLKAKIMGMEKLRRYDLYAPVKSTETKTNYEDSLKTVLKTFEDFDKDFKILAEKVVKDNHIHSNIQKGKRSGAFCYSASPKITPYVLLNYVGSYKDTSTLAHELGHAIHSMLASDKTLFDFHAPLPLAETASIFCEMILKEKLLKETNSKEEKIHSLVTQIDNIYASIMRQVYFILFEKEAHKAIEKGATIGELNKIYLNLLNEQFGDSLILPEIFQHEWKYIPHIYHTPFYCYAYAFGNLLVLSLFNEYKNQGESFIPKYKKILSYGGSESPEKILLEVGIDIQEEKFWQGGFDLIKNLVENLKKEIKNP